MPADGGSVQVNGQFDFSGIEQGLARVEGKLDAFARASTRQTATTRQSEGALRTLTGALGAFGISLSAVAIARAAWDMAELAMRADRATLALNAMSGGNAPEYIDAITTALRGTMADMDAAQIGARVLAFGFADTSAEAAEFVRVAAILGGAFQGLDATASAQSFAMLLTNLQPRRLDTFGLSIAAVRERQRELMETTRGMTTEQAFQTAVMDMATVRADQLSGILDDQASSVSRLRAGWINFKTTIGDVIADALIGTLDDATSAMDAFATNTATYLATLSQEARNNLAAIAFGLGQTALGTSLLTMGIERSTEAEIDGSAAADALAASQEAAAGIASELESALNIVSEADRAQQYEVWGLIAALNAGTITTDQAGAAMERMGIDADSVADHVAAYEDAVRELDRANREMFSNQTSFIGIARETAGAFEYVGSTAVAYPSELSAAYATLQDGLETTNADLDEARAHLFAFGDGTGELRERIGELEEQQLFFQQRLADTRTEMDATGQAFTIAALSAGDLAAVGDFTLQFLRATGQESLLAGEGVLALQERYGMASAAEIERQRTLLALDLAQESYNLTLDEQLDLLDRILAGELATADAVNADIEATRERQRLADLAANRPAWFDNLAPDDQAAAIAFLDGTTGAMQDQEAAAAGISETYPIAMSNAATAADTALPSIAGVERSLSTQIGVIRDYGPTATRAFDAVNRAAATMVVEGSGWSAFATSVWHVRNDLDFIMANANRVGRGATAAAPSPPAGEYAQGRQGGGPVTQGRTYVVGEEGPEYFVPAMSGMILPSAQSAPAGMGYGGGTMQIAIAIPVLIDGREVGRATYRGTLDQLMAAGYVTTAGET